MPLRSDPIGSPEDPERRARVEETYRKLLGGLKTLRDRLLPRRFYVLDRLLDRASGYLTKVSSGRDDSLTLGRFLNALDYLRLSLVEVAQYAGLDRDVPASVPGYLRSLRNRRRRAASPMDQFETLIRKGRKIRVESDGVEIEIDLQNILGMANHDGRSASALASIALERALIENRKSLEPETTERVVRLLAFVAHQHRKTDHRAAALELLDLAFLIESPLDRLDARALVYRTGAHLLSDLGHLEDALLFARRAERLSAMTGDSDALGRSLYVKASMFFYRGEYIRAIQSFRSSLALLPQENLPFRISAHHAIAYSLAELRRIDDAKAEVAIVDRLVREGDLSLDPSLRGNDLELRANLASLENDVSRAESLFDRAEQAYAQANASLDILILTLRRVQHSIRHDDLARARSLVESAAPLANRLEANETAKSVVLELFRSAASGALKLDLVERATRSLLFPGARITREDT